MEAEKIIKQQLLLETKLSRIVQHFSHRAKYPVGLITAFRGDPQKNLETNIQNNKQLAAKLREEDFGYVWVDGVWIENQGTPDEQKVSEISIFVIGKQGEDKKLLNTLIEESRKYDQEAFIFKPSGGKPQLRSGSTGKVIEEFSKLRIDDFADAYTRLRKGQHKGRTFFFEDVRNHYNFFSFLREKSIIKHNKK